MNYAGAFLTINTRLSLLIPGRFCTCSHVVSSALTMARAIKVSDNRGFAAIAEKAAVAEIQR